MRILFIDDHPVFIDGLVTYLSKVWPVLNIQRAYRSEDGIDLAREHTFDIILLDYDMPLIDDLDILTAFKQLRIVTPVLIISGVNSPKDIPFLYQAKKLNACGFIHKAKDPECIIKSIKAVIEVGYSWPNEVLSGIDSYHNLQNKYETHYNLSPYQQEVRSLLNKGYTYKKISLIRNISENTVKSHAKIIYEKMNVKSRAELMNLSLGLDKEPQS